MRSPGLCYSGRGRFYIADIDSPMDSVPGTGGALACWFNKSRPVAGCYGFVYFVELFCRFL
jgi:hypothetical protein